MKAAGPATMGCGVGVGGGVVGWDDGRWLGAPRAIARRGRRTRKGKMRPDARRSTRTRRGGTG
eukprot:1757951-Prymnesium_polylepis.1